ncbi:RAX [Mytilus edulis]|uniref:RAX n=1 Tax=Mytilus edulis TaxID=6550 RepID=A0A8S3RSZ4_MYTED|nr:RAX [Mytilus edulis]
MGLKDDLQSRRGRTKYTTEQLYALERSFCLSQYPDTATMEELADMCSVPTDKISTWFQNRRSKFKRQSKDSNIAWMRKHIFNRDPAVKENHVLSPPTTESTKCAPKSNLSYMTSVSFSYSSPPTPFYPPVGPYDMFNDILRDISSTSNQPTMGNSTPVQQFDNQTTLSAESSPDMKQAKTSPLQSSTPQQCSDQHLQFSQLQDRVSPVYSSPPQQMSSPDQEYMLNSSSDSSSCSIQTSPPSYHHNATQHQTSPPTQHHPVLFQRPYYLHQAYPWQYFQTSVAVAHRMYRR